jgi:hypothetical protein
MACDRIDMDHQMSEVTPGQEQLAEQIQKDRTNLVRNDPVLPGRW